MTTGQVNDQASRDAMEKQNLAGLRAMFNTITEQAPGRVMPPLDPGP